MAPSSPRSSIVVTTLAAAALFATTPTPARAWLRDFRSTATTATALNSNSPKSLALSCPGSHTAIGVGTEIRVDDVELQSIAPIGASRGASVVAAGETSPVSGGWALRGSAWCVQDTAVRPSLAAAASYVKDVTIVRNESSRDSTSRKDVTAICPTGRAPIGGGIGIVGSSSRVQARSLVRRSNGVSAVAEETQPTAANWAVEAHSICANVTTAASRSTYAGAPSGSDPGGLSSREGFSSRNSVHAKGAVAACGPGKYIVGGGAEVRGSAPEPPAGVAIKLSRPSLAGATATRWIAIASEVNPTLASWEVRAYAECATLNGAPLP